MSIAIGSLPALLTVATLSNAPLVAGHPVEWPRLHSSSQTPATHQTVKLRAERAEATLAAAETPAEAARHSVDAARDALHAVEDAVERRAAEAANAARRASMEAPEANMLADYEEMVDFYREAAATLMEDADRLHNEARSLEQQAQGASSTADDTNDYAQEVSRWAAAWRTDAEWIRRWQSDINDWAYHADLDVGPQATTPAHMPFGYPLETGSGSPFFLYFDGGPFGWPSWVDEFDLPGRLGRTREARENLLGLVAPAISEITLDAEEAVMDAREHLVRRRCGFRDDRSVCSRGGQRWLDALEEAAMAWENAAEAAARIATRATQHTSDPALRARHASEDAEAASRLAEALAKVVESQTAGSALERAREAARILTDELGPSGVIFATAREVERRMEERHAAHLAVAEEKAREATRRVHAEHEEALRMATAAAEEASDTAAPLLAAAQTARASYEDAAALLETYDTRSAAWSAARVAADEWTSARAEANRAALVAASLRLGEAMIAAGAASRKLTDAGETMIAAAGKIPNIDDRAVAAAAAALEEWVSRTAALRTATLRAGGTAAASVIGLASTGDLILDGIEIGEALLAADRAAETLLSALASIS